MSSNETLNRTAPTTEKLVLRKALRQQRNALDATQQASAAQRLAEQMQAIPLFQQSQRIALYLANDGEIDPSRVADWSRAHGKQCYVPIIPDQSVDTDNPTNNVLQFAEITAHTRFQKNRFGIQEPVVAGSELIDATTLDVVLLPLVGFDRCGNRLGMGGGFYDTTFAFKKTNPQRLPQLIGLAHECQRLEKINVEHWDIPLCAVVTDQHIYQFVWEAKRKTKSL